MAKIPEARLIKKEVMFRVLHEDPEVKLSKKSSIRFICLSLGLISPNETRTSLLDVFEVLLDKHLEGEGITAYEIIQKLQHLDDKTIYYHLKKLTSFGIVTKRGGEYFLGNGFGDDLVSVIEDLYKKDLEEMISSLRSIYTTLKQSKG